MKTEILEYEKLLMDHIKKNARSMLKKPNSYLKYPFMDPSSAYDGMLWDWDSFWATYALFNLADRLEADGSGTGDEKALFIEHSKGNVLNFFDFQQEDGYIPISIFKTELPEPYLIVKHKEGVIMNMHKPFLCQQICMIGGYSGDFTWVAGYFDNLERYFKYYEEVYMNKKTGLYVWANDIMLGVDNDPTTFGRPSFSTASIYLNSFLVCELEAMSIISKQVGMTDRALVYEEKSKSLIASIQKECWDPRDKFFYSADVKVETTNFEWFNQGLGVFWNTLPIKIRSWTGFIPMWSGIANDSQAAYLVYSHLADNNTFNCEYGLRSLAKDERMYNVSGSSNPSNWLGPVWIVTNYVVFRGLLRYGYKDEAQELCWKTVKLLGEDLKKSGTMHEFYVPENGQPVMNGNFLNWNILVLNMLDELDGKPPIDRFFRVMD